MKIEWGEDELSVWLEFTIADTLAEHRHARQVELERHEQNARAVAWWRAQRRQP